MSITVDNVMVSESEGKRSSMIRSDSELNSGLSPQSGGSEMNLSEYYTIAAVLAESPDNEALISFSNPNYGLDALNSNLLTPSSTTSSSSGGYDPVTGLLIHSLSSASLDNTPSQSGLHSPSTSTSNGATNLNELATGTLRPRVSVKREARSSEAGKSSDEDSDCYSDLSADDRFNGQEREVEEFGRDKVETGKSFCKEERSECRSVERNRLTNPAVRNDHGNGSSTGYGIYSPDSNDSGIHSDRSSSRRLNATESCRSATGGSSRFLHVDGQSLTSDNEETAFSSESNPTVEISNEVEVSDENLAAYGWEKHEDANGAYYWHIRSGTIQREQPTDVQLSLSRQSSQGDGRSDDTLSLQPGRSGDQSGRDGSGNNPSRDGDGSADDGLGGDRAGLPFPREYPLRFAVRSLGWIEMSEEDLTPERSSRSVNRCIMGLALGKNDINDAVGRWGDGKSLYMELDDENLALIDPQDLSILNIQSIQSIRVWGVGRGNGRERDFAYVARDHVTRKHMCHVFRCDGLARHIAAALRDICKRILAERSVRGVQGAAGGSDGECFNRSGSITRPNHLPNLGRVNDPPDGQHITFESLFKNTSFPTPMEEPKKILKCHYLGATQVNRATGVETLNNAMDKVYMSQPPAKWVYVNVAIAPSTITITEHGKPENVFTECRVRFLSFMGIAMNNTRLCSFIMHCAQDQFTAHVFHCDPSAGALCKTIEAACKLRYQKCLDAHQRYRRPVSSGESQKSSQQSKGIGSSIKQGVQSVLGNLAKGCKPNKA